MFKDKSLNLCGVWRGLTGVINLCPNCYQKVEETAWGSMQIQQKKRKTPLTWCEESFVSVLIPFQTDTNEWEALHFSEKRQAAVLFTGGGVGRRVNFKPPLSIVGCVSACFGNIPCKLCIEGFSVHVHTVHVHKNTNPYLCPSPVQGIYVKIKWNEEWN